MEEIIRESIGIWRKNRVICIPFILEMVALGFLLAVGAFILLVPLNPFKGTDYADPLNMIESIDWTLILIDLVIAAIILLIMALASSFLRAGAIGMAKEAITNKKTSLDDMIRYGRDRALPYFLVTVAMILMNILLLIILLIPMIILGSEVINLASFILGLSLALVTYAAVIEGGAIKGVKKGIDAFMKNKLETALLYAFTAAFSLIVYAAAAGILMLLMAIALPLMDIEGQSTMTWIMISIIVGAGVLLFTLAQTCIVSPLETIYWTKYYLTKTRGGER
jgi:hypothetical protein